MKPIRLLSLALLAALLAACSQAPLSDALPEPPAPADPHKVPVAVALAELNSLLEAIDGPETRSGGARRVASVEALGASALARATRAGHDAATAAEIGDLVYIANFQNGEGYAILGADDRIESVIAVTERGSLTPAQLAAAANGQYDGVEAPPVVPEIGDYLIERIGGIHKYDSLASIFPTYEVSYGPWEFADKKGPYCKMKWGQGYPYNYYAPLHNGVHCKVGCVAVALGQIIATNYYNEYYPDNLTPYPLFIGGWAVKWPAIFNDISMYDEKEQTYYDKNSAITNEVVAIAAFLRGIGEEVNMDYGLESSSAKYSKAEQFMKTLYKDVDYHTYSEKTCGRVKEMVIDRGLPTFMRGQKSGGGGHAWVVDGAIVQRRLKTAVSGPSKGSTSYESIQYYHCNYGWAGVCDGYYHYYTLGNVNKIGKNPEKGDRESQGEPNDYTRDTWIMYYNL